MDDLAKIDYEARRAEERDRMNARLQTWTIFLSLVGAFGFASAQSGNVAYVAALYPLLAASLAYHVRHSEDALHLIRKYLFQFEQTWGFQGWEHWTRQQPPRKTHGGYMDALRVALIVTQSLATAAVVARLVADQLAWWSIPVVAIELVAVVGTWRWLRK